MRTKLLLVEDNQELLALLAQAFGDEYEILTATDGEEALRQAARNPPDLIVLDLVLPLMDGFQVCEILRRNSKTSKIPILLYSGLPGELTRLTALDSGGTDFISKPCEPSRLVSKARALLSASHLANKFLPA